jgi:hypothetical protein
MVGAVPLSAGVNVGCSMGTAGSSVLPQPTMANTVMPTSMTTKNDLFRFILFPFYSIAIWLPSLLAYRKAEIMK